MVDGGRYRSGQRRPQALEAHARERGPAPARSDSARRRCRSGFEIVRCGQQAACLTTADMLTGMAAVGSLFHTATGTAFADLVIDGHRETWPIRSKRFRTWLRRRYYQETGSALSAPII